MNFQEYLTIRQIENPLDYVKRIVVKAYYPNGCHYLAKNLNNGTIFVKGEKDSRGEYFDIYGNNGNTIFNDPVTNNRVAIEMCEDIERVGNRLKSVSRYIGTYDQEKLEDYLLVCPMLFTILPDEVLKESGDKLFRVSVDSLRKHFKLFSLEALDRGFDVRSKNNLMGIALSNNFLGGLSKIYTKRLVSRGCPPFFAKQIVRERKNQSVKVENYQAKVERMLAFADECEREVF